jgi:hypothetical protein
LFALVRRFPCIIKYSSFTIGNNSSPPSEQLEGIISLGPFHGLNIFKLRPNAIHEAGHVVVAFGLGFQVEEAHITENDGEAKIVFPLLSQSEKNRYKKLLREGRTKNPSDYYDQKEIETIKKAEKNISVHMAGWIAEETYLEVCKKTKNLKYASEATLAARASKDLENIGEMLGFSEDASESLVASIIDKLVPDVYYPNPYNFLQMNPSERINAFHLFSSPESDKIRYQSGIRDQYVRGREVRDIRIQNLALHLLMMMRFGFASGILMSKLSGWDTEFLPQKFLQFDGATSKCLDVARNLNAKRQLSGLEIAKILDKTK